MEDEDKLLYTMEELYQCSLELGEAETYIECIHCEEGFGVYIYSYFNKPHNDDIYFVVCNHLDIRKATKITRIKLFKHRYKIAKDNPADEFVLSADQKKRLIEILNMKYRGIRMYFEGTNWECILHIYDWCTYNNSKMRNLLKKAKHKMPDYTKL